MTNSITYLVQRLGFRIIEFIRHWYIRSTRMYWHFIFNKLERLDYSLAWKITLKNLFRPLYKDYTILGYVLGFFFRLGRLILGTVIYVVLFAIAAAAYLFWLLFPIALIYRIFTA